MKRVLVIWWEAPEEVYFVKLMVNDEDYERLRKMHNHLINATDDDKMADEINRYFYKEDDSGEFKFKKEHEEPLTGVVCDLIIITGIAT